MNADGHFFSFWEKLIGSYTRRAHFKKTKASKAILIFWDVLLFSIVGFTLSYLINLNQARLKFPESLTDRILVIVAFLGFLYFLFDTIRKSVNECKTYVFGLSNKQIKVNNKPFSEHSQAALKIIKSVGWEGLGQSYKICLTKNKKRKIISFGNTLENARKASSIIADFLKIKTM